MWLRYPLPQKAPHPALDFTIQASGSSGVAISTQYRLGDLERKTTMLVTNNEG